MKPKVLIAHPVPLTAAGLAATLAHACDAQVLPPAALRTLPPGGAGEAAVVATDHHSALALLAHAQAAGWPRPRLPRCLVVGTTPRGWSVRQALEQGVLGYVGGDCALTQLLDAVRSVHRGQRYLCASASAGVAAGVAQEPLTPREMDVLHLLGQGLDNKSISAQLDITLGTVKSHVKAVLDKLLAGSRTQAVRAALDSGLIGDDIGWRGRC